MELKTKRTVQAPIDLVFQEFTNFVWFESVALSRGLNIERTDAMVDIQTGISWHLSGRIRGKQRDVDIAVTQFIPQKSTGFRCESKALDSQIDINFTPDGPARTKVKITIAPTAKNISARLMLQSVKLAQKTIEKRISSRMKDFCTTIEEKHASA
ncbi:hypothetical protein GCM10008927_06660 [Amylibacter ulvae]|uniref:Uncharacterized protein n=1 Tax=Paramylibacter ulvae TaxID=1651968 RepID=A0ABQ3CWF1_9RHOB|nr:hypothetical protein [Amylibacter ulvae]GHA44476.1 hypothetical protein GCM10008927_06660 [Amylibacter ulvae]